MFGKELYSGETVCYRRYKIEGIADETLLPEWAKAKLEMMRVEEPKKKARAEDRCEKPVIKSEQSTLFDELNDAKAEVLNHAERHAAEKDARGFGSIVTTLYTLK